MPEAGVSRRGGQPRVLFFVNRFPSSEHPGQGAFVREQARAAAGVADVVLLCNDGPARAGGFRHTLTEDQADGLPVLRLSYAQPPGPLPHLGYRRGIREAVRRLEADGFRPDLIHAHFYIAGATAVRLGRRLGVPAVISEHSSKFPSNELRGPALRRARFALGSAAVVCPVSRHLQEHIVEAGVDARFRVVPNAVDVSEFYPPAAGARPRGDSLRLLFVGHLIPEKGVEHLLQALVGAGFPWQLTLAGGGDGRDELERLAADLGLADRVEFPGELGKPAIANLMRAADVFVLPSLAETQGVVLIEAMASGLPFVATRVGGVPETVEPRAGVLVPPADPEALRGGLEQVVGEIDRYDSDAIAAAAGRRFGYEAVGAMLAEVYREAVRLREA